MHNLIKSLKPDINPNLQSSLTKKNLIYRGLIVLALLFAFAFILSQVWALRTLHTDGNVTWMEMNFDMAVRGAIIDTRNPVMTEIFRAFSWLADPDRIIIYCIVLILIPKTRWHFGVQLGLASLAAVEVQTLIKTTVMRPRPDIADFLIKQGGYSFPSGHSCAVLVFFWFMAYLIFKNVKNRRTARILGGICIGIVPVIGFSRVYLGVHYPTDVLGGWSLGCSLLLIAITIYEIVIYLLVKRRDTQ